MKYKTSTVVWLPDFQQGLGQKVRDCKNIERVELYSETDDNYRLEAVVQAPAPEGANERLLKAVRSCLKQGEVVARRFPGMVQPLT